MNVGDLVRYKRFIGLGGRMGAKMIEEDCQGIILRTHIIDSKVKFVDLVLNNGEQKYQVSILKLELLNECG
jgi:hypothetical protein